MKKLIILQFFIVGFIFAQGQNNFGISTPKKELKNANVKTLKVYLMQKKSDSTLLREDLYDAAGNIILRKIYSKKGNLTTQNTFEYDASDYLVKSTSADGISRLAVTNYTNDANGNLLSFETIMDGKVLNTIVKDTNGETSKFYSYNFDRLLIEIKTKKNVKGRRTAENETYVYYINGLTKIYLKGIKKGKPNQIQRAYYTFY